MPSTRVLPARGLEQAVTTILAAGGSQDGEARQVATSLVDANLRGHDSHGVGMVPRYVEALLDGGLRPNRTARMTLDIGTMLAVDGDRGYGQVIGAAAMTRAIERARQHGSCVLAVANTHHLARIGQFAEMAVAAGLVSIHFVNVLSRPIVAPWGGSDARFGTNPCCVGIPLPGEPPFILDFATSVVAQGKMRVAHNKGEAVKPGLLIDDQGRPTTDPRYGVVPPVGAIMPFGEHKGYGLAIACELLGGALTGSGTENGMSRGDRRVVNGMLAILIDPTRLDSATFAAQARSFLDWLRQSSPAPDFDRVRIAGEPEREMRAHRLAAGIPVDGTTWQAIRDAAHTLGIAPDAIEALAGGEG
ncbi:MAG: malate/lactate/ureidoglycolate dehydrogenase [Casimicrobiaceae bacterium]